MNSFTTQTLSIHCILKFLDLFGFLRHYLLIPDPTEGLVQRTKLSWYILKILMHFIYLFQNNSLDYNLTFSSEITFCIHIKAKYDHKR